MGTCNCRQGDFVIDVRQLRGPVYPYYHIVFAELADRGEDLSPDLPVPLKLMRSDNRDCRRHGWLILRRHFPKVADLAPEFDPNGSVEDRGQAMLARPDPFVT